MKVIIDSNIWISFIIGKTIYKLKPFIDKNYFRIIVTDKLIYEILDVSRRQRFKKYFNNTNVQTFIEYLKSISLNVHIISTVSLCRDEHDNYLLALALDSEADYLITGDRDLLNLGSFQTTAIIKFSAFMDILKDSQ